jgi:hypothetical protein
MRRQFIGTSFIIGIFLFLVGCGSTSILNSISDKYPLEDVVESSTDADDTARIFVAKNENLSEVSTFIQGQNEPNDASEIKDNKQVLIYDDYFVTLTQDEDNAENTLIEVASHGFVRDNYSPSFFDGLLTYYLLSNLFGVDDWGKRQNQRCIGAAGSCYKGYNQSGGAYKGPTAPSTFRGSGIRGGGPGTGK